MPDGNLIYLGNVHDDRPRTRLREVSVEDVDVIASHLGSLRDQRDKLDAQIEHYEKQYNEQRPSSRVLGIHSEVWEEGGVVYKRNPQTGLVVRLVPDPASIKVANRTVDVAETAVGALKPLALLGAGAAGFVLAVIVLRMLNESNND